MNSFAVQTAYYGYSFPAIPSTPPKHRVVFALVWNAEPVGMQGFLIMELNSLTNYKSLFLVEKEGDISQQGCI